MKQHVIKKINTIQSITIITLGLFTLLNCKAQSPIITLEDWDGTEIDNAYYKDVNNVLNNFEGTWLFENGNTSLEIVLVKSLQFFNGDYYEDTIVGGYRYVEDGVEKINTLDDANNPNLGFSASIDGNTVYESCKYLPVDDCVDGEKYLDLSINDVTSDGHIGDLIVSKRVVNGQEVIKINIAMNYYKLDYSPDGEMPDPTLPWTIQNMVLVKQ